MGPDPKFGVSVPLGVNNCIGYFYHLFNNLPYPLNGASLQIHYLAYDSNV